ncbi:MAG: hypothetical protein K2K84_00320 [Muribaculaceae bacterium]|nr:hypothetical protein [Muribaculaceae bacterium]
MSNEPDTTGTAVVRRRRRRAWISVAAVVLGVVIAVVGWWGYRRYLTSLHGLDVVLDRSKYPVRGIDVSHHNGLIDFGAVRGDSIDFVYIKASDGVGDVDSNFVRNYHAAKAAGLKVGAYHFFRTHRGGRQQAAALLDAVSGLDLDLPLVIDLETESHERGNKADVVPRVRTMLYHLHDAGYRTMLYANYDQFSDFIDGNFSNEDLWLATSREPSHEFDPRTVWQFSHHGSVSGIDGPVDLNAFIGTPETFGKWSSSARR